MVAEHQVVVHDLVGSITADVGVVAVHGIDVGSAEQDVAVVAAFDVVTAAVVGAGCGDDVERGVIGVGLAIDVGRVEGRVGTKLTEAQAE